MTVQCQKCLVELDVCGEPEAFPLCVICDVRELMAAARINETGKSPGVRMLQVGGRDVWVSNRTNIKDDILR